ncbi:LA_2272 family surface repeat-containing protein [Confluentibacter citreus]|uniref:LA_2272 family surface repeat-containing protein n=1 Tax=Confluentibacter citreus TaxID=2007307 RepID=UPI000C288FE0|nr:hypothetical protein [Confluentibacter citreus]
MKNLTITIIFLISIKVLCQDFNEKTRYLFGTFHTQNTTINGISVGAFPEFNEKKRFVRTNGIRLEIPGLGLVGLLANGSLIRKEETDEIINGLNISGGTMGNVSFNGITLALLVQSGTENNGIAIAGLWNGIDKSNGIQIAVLLNEATYSNGIQIALSNSTEYMTGIQIGLLNKSKKTKGIQLGLWNINEKRKLPIINWN